MGNNNSSCLEGGEVGIRILLPLCGKSVDMVYLAGYTRVDEVVGIDGVKRALVSGMLFLAFVKISNSNVKEIFILYISIDTLVIFLSLTCHSFFIALQRRNLRQKTPP